MPASNGPVHALLHEESMFVNGAAWRGGEPWKMRMSGYTTKTKTDQGAVRCGINMRFAASQ